MVRARLIKFLCLQQCFVPQPLVVRLVTLFRLSMYVRTEGELYGAPVKRSFEEAEL
jgi:hypothetical protein